MTEEFRELSADERMQYTEAANKQMLEFDTRILWFSGGGLVAVLAFAGTMNVHPSPLAIASFSLGAVLLLSSSGVTLYSFQRSAADIARFLDNPTASFRAKQMKRMWRLNIWSLWLAVGGLALLGLFAVLVLASK